MTNQNLLDLLIEIRDSNIFSPTKDDYRNKGIREPMELAHAYDLIEEYGKNENNFRLTKNGYTVINSQGDISVLDRSSVSIQSQNNHLGDNYGTYNQTSSKDLNKSTLTKAEDKTIKRIAIGVFVTVIGGIILWWIIKLIK